MTGRWAAMAVLMAAVGCGGDDDLTGSQVLGQDEACAVPEIDPDAARPASLLRHDWLAYLATRVPCVEDASLRAILESPDTMFYDRWSMRPGYQDSFGDNVILPIGMRPNSISASHIDLAVPGGHAQIFRERGIFHFPFGRPIGSHEADHAVVDFWYPPRDAAGALLPVAHYKREPNGDTHRVEWVFPVSTVFGELMFVLRGEHWVPFEIRTRTRTAQRWVANAYRPFPTADALRERLEEVREDDPAWSASAEIDALIAHLERDDTLVPASLSATRFPGAFKTVQGAVDTLPALSDDTILVTLMRKTRFRSARGAVWKQHGNLVAYAPTTKAAFSIVPRGYNGGLIAVDDDSCTRCHADAGRPFRDWYPNIIAYGELWGQDEIFTWHPFDAAMFVGPDGDVRNFNHDNRRMRSDFTSAGLIAPFDPARHAPSHYTRIARPWHDYAY